MAEEVLKVYTLRRPVKVGEVTCTEVKLCRPRWKDFAAVKSLPLTSEDAMIAFVSSVSGLSETIVRQFDIEDASRLRVEVPRAYDSFFWTVDYELDPPPPPAPEGAAESAPEAGTTAESG
jgi:hypothetical protein